MYIIIGIICGCIVINSIINREIIVIHKRELADIPFVSVFNNEYCLVIYHVFYNRFKNISNRILFSISWLIPFNLILFLAGYVYDTIIQVIHFIRGEK